VRGRFVGGDELAEVDAPLVGGGTSVVGEGRGRVGKERAVSEEVLNILDEAGVREEVSVAHLE
jgi:hypothetical protein